MQAAAAQGPSPEEGYLGWDFSSGQAWRWGGGQDRVTGWRDEPAQELLKPTATVQGRVCQGLW